MYMDGVIKEMKIVVRKTGNKLFWGKKKIEIPWSLVLCGSFPVLRGKSNKDLRMVMGGVVEVCKEGK